MKIRFSLDENISPSVVAALHRLDRAIDVVRVGQSGAPPRGTSDPEILMFCAANQRLADEHVERPAAQ